MAGRPNVQTRLQALTPWIFALVSLAFSLSLAWTVPPFMGPDETVHLLRADMLAQGGRITPPAPGGSGRATGVAHAALFEASAPLEHVRFDPAIKVARADLAKAELPLDDRFISTSPHASVNFALYVPSALGLKVGDIFHWRIVDAIRLARALQAVACAGLGFIALRIARRSQLLLFVLLTLPMTQSLFGAVTQDGPIIALTAVGVALVARAIYEGRPLRLAESLAATTCFAMAALAKTPYAALLLLLLWAPTERPRLARTATVAGFAGAVFWLAWTSRQGWAQALPPGFTADPSAQLAWILHHPLALGGVAARTLLVHGREYALEFIGILGWLDTMLPLRFYPVAYLALAISVALSLGPPPADAAWRRFRWSVPPPAALAVGGIFAGLYLTWTAVGAPTVEGVQARYLIPVGLVLTLLAEGPRTKPPSLPARISSWALLAFPIAGLIVTQASVIHRYYA